jgi:hypothetical protein
MIGLGDVIARGNGQSSLVELDPQGEITSGDLGGLGHAAEGPGIDPGL